MLDEWKWYYANVVTGWLCVTAQTCCGKETILAQQRGIVASRVSCDHASRQRAVIPQRHSP